MLPVTLLAGSILLAGCAGSGASTSEAGASRATTSERAPTRNDAGPTLQDRPCDPTRAAALPSSVRVECHWLAVPVRRSTGDGRTFRLAVTVVRSPGADPTTVPVVYVSGGPGGPGGAPNDWVGSPTLARRDVVLFDQRGTGQSEPDMDCPEVEAAAAAAFERDDPFAVEVDLRRSAEQACQGRLQGSGIDLGAFSTPETAADVEDLRRALGVERWSLLGVSYGTRVALEVVRRYPGSVAGVVLDSTLGVEATSASLVVEGGDRAVAELVAACSADRSCVATHADLRAEIDALVDRLNASPFRGEVDLGAPFGVRQVTITGRDLMLFIFGALTMTDLIPALPATIRAMGTAPEVVLPKMVAAAIQRNEVFAEGTTMAVSCADRSPLLAADPGVDDAVLADPGNWTSTLLTYSFLWCRGWPSSTVPSAFVEPVTADVPTLVLAGRFDPVTPAPRARSIAQGLGHATFVELPKGGHHLWDASDCTQSIVDAFLSMPAAPVGDGCATAAEPSTP